MLFEETPKIEGIGIVLYKKKSKVERVSRWDDVGTKNWKGWVVIVW